MKNKTKIIITVCIVITLVVVTIGVLGILNNKPVPEEQNQVETLIDTLSEEEFGFKDLGLGINNVNYDDTLANSPFSASYEELENYEIYKTGELSATQWILELPLITTDNQYINNLTSKISNWSDLLNSSQLSNQTTQTVIYDSVLDSVQPIVIGYEKTKKLTIAGVTKLLTVRNSSVYITDIDFSNPIDVLQSSSLAGSEVTQLYYSDDDQEENAVTFWVQMFTPADSLEFESVNVYKVVISNTKSFDTVNLTGFISTSSLVRLVYLEEENNAIVQDFVDATTSFVDREEEQPLEEEEGEVHEFLNTKLFYFGKGVFLVNLNQNNTYFWIAKDNGDTQDTIALPSLTLINRENMFLGCSIRKKECIVLDFRSLVYYKVDLNTQEIIKDSLPETFEDVKLSGIRASMIATGGVNRDLVIYDDDRPYLWYLGRRLYIL